MNNGFWNLEGPFFTIVSRLIDIIWLSMLFLLTSIPVFTIGSSLAALYYTVHKSVRHGRGYATKEYFKAFASNFKQATPVCLLLLVIYGLLSYEIYVTYQYALNGLGFGKIYIVLMIVMCFVMMWTIYLFAYMARFKNSTGLILKNAMFFMISNFAEAIFLLMILFLGAFLLAKWMWLILVVPATFMLIADFFIERVFRKYMTPEDLADEDERDAVYKD